MKLLTIVVTYNAMQWIERCIVSLYTSSILPDVFIVDNGSTDGTQSFIQEHYPNVLFRQSIDNLGFGKANNMGLQYALDHQYDYVYLLNQDAWIMPDTLSKLISVSENNTDFGILSPMQFQADGRTLDKTFCRNITRFGYNVELVSDMLEAQLQKLYTVNRVMAAHWLITSECLKKVGGFSPTFSHYGEDDNYIDRVHFYRFKVGIVTGCKAIHDRGNRIIPSTQRLHLLKMGGYTIFSNPEMNLYSRTKKYISFFLRNAVKYPHWKQITNALSLCLKWHVIKKNRTISITTKTPFLHGTL